MTAVGALGIEGYREFLVRRDGEADLLHRHLASREEFFGGLVTDPVRSRRPIDRGVFARNLRRRRPEPGLSREMLFLLATAKLNQAERFGVGLGETYGHNSGDDAPTERVYIELEEHYHTRLLAYVLDIFGLPFQVMPPPFVMRQFVKLNVFIPERIGIAFVGAGEMAGCILFDELRRVGVELFADEPDVAARIERLYSEILTDEIGHVGYCAARCTSGERAVMRWLYPRVGRLFARETAEISLLIDPKMLHARLDEPFNVDELTSGLPNETFLRRTPEDRLTARGLTPKRSDRIPYSAVPEAPTIGCLVPHHLSPRRPRRWRWLLRCPRRRDSPGPKARRTTLTCRRLPVVAVMPVPVVGGAPARVPVITRAPVIARRRDRSRLGPRAARQPESRQNQPTSTLVDRFAVAICQGFPLYPNQSKP